MQGSYVQIQVLTRIKQVLERPLIEAQTEFVNMFKAWVLICGSAVGDGENVRTHVTE